MRALMPSKNATGSLLGGYLANMSEAMAVRRANAEARRAQLEAELSIKARSEFLANMNHELRTPLNAIIGFATMLRENDQYKMTPEQSEEYADYILQSADLLLSHINTILETAALDGGDITLTQESVDLADILQATATRAKIAAGAANVVIDLKDSTDAVPVWADAERVGQAIDHLIRTAIRLSPKDSTVLMRAVVNQDGWGEIAIRDNSAGFDQATLARALSAFGEVNRGLDRSFSGPGIDLAIAKTFIEMQGGRFNIKSKEGQGTLVRVSFPPPVASEDAADMALAG